MKIGYARVSTEDQTLDAQIRRLEEAGCERIFREKESGTKSDRPKLSEALDHLRKGDTLVVWRLDRLARSMSDLLAKVDRVEEEGADFQVLDQNIDTTTPQGRLVFNIMGALAEFEADLASKRTKEGLRSAVEEGRVGRPRTLSEEDIPQVQALMRDPNISTSDICDRFDMSRTTLYDYVGPDGERRR